MTASEIKAFVRQIPILGRAAVEVHGRLWRWGLWRTFPGSLADWREHYERGGASGCGSYGMLAEFKAEMINRFVADQGIRTVVEFGCGDGNQLALGRYPSYVGLDIAPGAIARCQERFANDPTKSFFLYDPHAFVDRAGIFAADLALSLDVIFHLVEDELFDLHMRHLFGSGQRAVIVYSSDRDERTGHPGIRHRAWTEWVAANAPAWRLRERIPNRYPYVGDARTGSFADLFIYER